RNSVAVAGFGAPPSAVEVVAAANCSHPTICYTAIAI
ncbi:hypothetical protein A2U01_0030205, partial [Trifolium medium]|nr:hypothetical protein [Trifolium medium]